MSIQIVAQRLFKGADKAVFVFTDPPIVTPNLSQIFTNYHAILEKLPESEWDNIFYCLAHHQGAGTSNFPSRTRSTFEFQTMIAWDIDSADTQRGLEYAAAVARVLQCPAETLVVVSSGNGIHVLAALKHPIRSVSYFDENKQAYNETCKLINAQLIAAKLPGYADPVIFEPARVLRLPGSYNVKPGKERKPCMVLQTSISVLDLDLQKLSGVADRKAENVSPAEIRRQYPVPDFPEIVKECDFIKWTVEHPEEVHEPHLFDLASLMVPQSDQIKIDLPPLIGKVSARDLTEYVFKKASASDSLKLTTFDDKWEQAKEYGGRKCSTIDQHWGRCQACPHYGKIPTPLALKSKAHIASEQLGFWVLGAKGQHLNPAYEDLAKVFKEKKAYIVTEESRILLYDRSLYRVAFDAEAKAWLEATVNPTEPLRESHRSEFVAKIKATGFIPPDEQKYIFDTSIRGKLNCSNGILDMTTGQLIEHSKDFGFLYQLPYEVDLNSEGPEEFLDWLAKITEDRIELMDSILDLMAYILWPSYDDHLFAYLIGEGANGKSTLIHVIQAMVGIDNYSTVGIQQLGSNRFAPAQLEGKLVNLSEESSGGKDELDFEAMNSIKTLCSGGTMLVERKGQDGFKLTNKAKLIFSANQTPRFRETGHAVKRRMLALPFDHRITSPDTRVESRLIAQVPQIVAFLVRRIQVNITANGGRFLVSRGGMPAEDAQKKALMGNGSITEWAIECIDTGTHLGKDAYVAVDEAYRHYGLWCDENGYKNKVSKPTFGRTMCELVVTKAAQGHSSQTKRVGGKSVRVYSFTRFKEGVMNAAAAN